MTIQATDLVGSRMNFMGEKDRLFRLIILLTAQPDGGLYNKIASNYKENKSQEGEIYFITIKWDGIMGWNAGFIIRKFPKIAVNLQKDQHNDGQYQGKNSVQETVIGFQCFVAGPSFGFLEPAPAPGSGYVSTYFRIASISASVSCGNVFMGVLPNWI